jgi:hypothetical protein
MGDGRTKKAGVQKPQVDLEQRIFLRNTYN